MRVSSRWVAGCAALFLLAGALVLGPGATPAGAAGVDQYGPPIWWPLRGDNLIGCTYLSTDGTVSKVCNGTYHPYWAIDIEAPKGQAVYASGAGLAYVYTDSTACGAPNYGRSVVVDHNGRRSLYGHLDHFSDALTNTPNGVWVDEKTIIGYVGHTGNVSGCNYDHLHYEESTGSTFGAGSTDPGVFLACSGSSMVSFPNGFGYTSWQGFPAHLYTAHTDISSCATSPPATTEGSFVSHPAEPGLTFRIVGGFPLPVASCAALGGCAGVTSLANPSFRALPASIEDGAVVKIVDGTSNGQLLRAAGGALVPISSCTPIGGCEAIDVNESSVQAYRAANPNMRNGTYVKWADGPSAGLIGGAAGGAVLVLGTCDPQPGCPLVPNVELTAAGLDAYRAAHPRPIDGTVLFHAPVGGYWGMSGGGRTATLRHEGAVALTEAAIRTIPLAAPDAQPGSAFYDDIDWLLGRGIARGNADGTFGSYEPISRQAMAAFLYRYAGSPNGPKPACNGPAATDVPQGALFCGEIQWLLDEGIATGYQDGFHPTEPISRLAMAAFLYRFAGSPNGLAPVCSAPAATDVPIGPFCGEIAWMITSGVSTGYLDGSFKPSRAVQRNAMAAFLHRFSALPAAP